MELVPLEVRAINQVTSKFYSLILVSEIYSLILALTITIVFAVPMH